MSKKASINKRDFDVVVIGGGVIGLNSAYALAKQGARVLLVEKRHLGSGASGCSAAMLECQTHAYRGNVFLSLARRSLRLYADLYDELLDLTGIDFEYDNCGILNIALTGSDAVFLRNNVEAERAQGHSADWLAAEDVVAAYPHLDPEQYGAAFYPEDGQINGEKFVSALADAFRRKGGKIIEGAACVEFVVKSGKAKALQVDDQQFGAGLFLVAAGAWSPFVLEPLGFRLDVEPVKGQLLFYSMDKPMIDIPVFAQQYGYVAPKKSGFYLVGTTAEKVGFDEQPTETAKALLIEKGRRLLPGLSRAGFRGASAGLRPGTKAELPFLGFVPGHANVLVAAGHFRNGILLAPVTAEIMSSFAFQRADPIDLSPFSLPARGSMI